MNRTHRIVFNRALGVFQAVSEHACGRGKCKAIAGIGVCALALIVSPGAQADLIIGDGEHLIVDDEPRDVGGNFFVGPSGSTSSSLTIRNGGVLISAESHIGHGGVGAAIVTGTTSRWQSSRLYVGNAGQGTLDILDGATVSADEVGIGVNPGGALGRTRVSGAGSNLTSGGRLLIGHAGSGALTVEDGGLAAAPQVYMGGLPGTGISGTGDLTLAGADTRRGVLATGFLEVGLGSGGIQFDGGILRATGNETNFLRNFKTGDVTLADGGAFIDSNGYDIGIGAQLSGTGGLTKIGAGVLTLSGQNVYSGGTTINGGEVVATTTGALGSGPVIIDGPNGWPGATYLTFDGPNTNASDLDITVDSGRLVVLNGASAGSATIINDTDFLSFFFVDYSDAGSAHITNRGGISFSGTSSAHEAAIINEGGAASNFFENSSAGRAALTNTAGGGTTFGGDSTADEATIVNEANGMTDISQINDAIVIGSVSGDGDIYLGGKGLTLGGLDRNDVIGGVIQDGGLGAGTGGSLVKTGSGTLTLAGTNTYTGATTVESGRLIVAGSIASSSLLTIQDGATLGGSGTVGATAVADGGILAPGSSIGTLTIQGSLSLSSGSILDYELGAPGASSSPAAGTSDRIDVTGDLVLDGILNLAQSPDSSDGTVGLGYYRLMTYGGALTNNDLEIDATPHPSAGLYAIQAGGGHVDLFVPASGTPDDDTFQYWQGGDGSWNAGAAQWLNHEGDLPVSWAGNHAVFKNQPGGFNGGSIDVEDTQRFAGLQFVDEGYRLQGTGALEAQADGAEIRVLADRAEIATEITGVGGISKTEAGLLVLSGVNTYRGGTTISKGVLSVSSDANLGDAQSRLAFEGGVLQVTGGAFTGTGRDIIWGARGGGFDIADASNDFLIDQNLAGLGDLLKRGEGTLTLAGKNAYGNTRVEQGRLQGDAASISGHIANAGIVAFIQNDEGRFAGDITGLGGVNGGMIKGGAGLLSLEGRSTLDWMIADGTLATAAARFGGNAHLAGAASALMFNDAEDAEYGGVISGVGQFSLDGTGTVLLTGDSSHFAGTTVLAHGTLRVGGTAGNGALGGSLDIRSGAMLGGSGTVGSGAGSAVTVASGGTLAPGNSIGTLTVDGDLVFEPGSRLAVEVNPQGAGSDRVTVTGKATLHGGSVAHVGANGNYDLRSAYTILTAGGALSGTFDEVSSDFAFLTPELTYDYGAGTVDLELARNDRDFASVALTRNQRAVAGGIESIGFDASHALYDAIAQLPDDDVLIRDSLNALSGEIHASAKTALIEDSRFIRHAANDRVRAAFATPGASTAPVQAYGPAQARTQVSASDSGPVVWSQAFGSWGSTDSDGNAAGLDRDTGGLLIGADRRMGDWRVGLLAGYSRSDFKARDRASSVKSDNYHLGLYGGTQWDALGLRAGLAYTWHDIDTKRSVSLPGLRDSAGAGYHAGTLQVFGELGYGINAGAVRFEPFASLAHVRLRTDGFSERGGAAALSGRSENTDVTFSTLGLRAEYRLSASATKATLRAALGWRHAFGDTTPVARQGFSAGDAFAMAGVPIAKDSAIVEAGVDLSLTSNATFGFSYSGQLAGSSRDHGVKANLAIRF